MSEEEKRKGKRNLVAPNSYRWENDLYKIRNGDRPIVCAQTLDFRFFDMLPRFETTAPLRSFLKLSTRV